MKTQNSGKTIFFGLMMIFILSNLPIRSQNACQIVEGPFKPDWDSLSAYSTPEWYRDAKFGIWTHKSP